MYLTILATALGAIGQGMAQTSMNGANLYFPSAFGLTPPSPRSNLIIGLINSAIYLSNGLCGAWLVAPLNDALGRRGAVGLAAIVSLVSNLAAAMAPSWEVLLVMRLVLGCALGVVSSTLNVFAAESVPSQIRGALGVSWQMFCAGGIMLGFIANVVVFDWGENVWRVQLAMPAVVAVPLVVVVWLCPESPAWYGKHGRWEEAHGSLVRLRGSEVQAAREVWMAYQARDGKGGRGYLRSVKELFTVPRIRRATMGAYTVMIAQQLYVGLFAMGVTY